MALDFDAAIATRAVLEENRAREEMKEHGEEAGIRTVDAEDLETALPDVKGIMGF